MDPVVPPASTPGRPQPALDTPRISERPVPSTQLADPRQYQLSQLRRRFSPKEHDENSTTVLEFRMRPSDPDFAFDIDALNCVLRIPLDYPKGAPPSLTVTNPEMERGYQINVERGFDKIVAQKPAATLLTHLNSLDRQLEQLLILPKAETIKIVTHAKNPDRTQPVPRPTEEHKPSPRSQPASTSPQAPPDRPSAQELAAAQEARSREIRQLESRLGRLPQFSKSNDGITYTIPIEPRKRSELPIGLQAIKLVKLIVPHSYNLEPCRIELVGVEREAASTAEEAFMLTSKSKQLTLLSSINYLSQNMHAMASQKQQDTSSIDNIPRASPSAIPEMGEEANSPENRRPQQPFPGEELDRPHIITIPRPPEWAMNLDEGESSESASDEADEEMNGEEELANEQPSKPQATVVFGTRIVQSFPHLELYGIELLELVSLNITIKCDRCKTPKDITNLQSITKGGLARHDFCNKCSTSFEIGI